MRSMRHLEMRMAIPNASLIEQDMLARIIAPL